MINIEEAKDAFNNYVSQFDEKNLRVQVKKRHTLSVVNVAKIIAEKLNLSDEDISLAQLIALLHDIGRFEQEEIYHSFEDNEINNHAQIGVDLLFKRNLIRNFIQEDKYDEIISRAIFNHNKFEIEKGLSKKELLHCRLIRDADKTDNFKVKQYQDLKTLLGKTKEDAEKEKITDKVWQQFLAEKTIISSTRVTAMDHWISFLAWIYDYNFVPSLEYVEETKAIDKVINRLNYKDSDTKNKMEYAREALHRYIREKIR